MTNRLNRGYSLLEIMFVMAISAVLAAVAVPMSGNALGFFRLSGDARKLSNAVAVTKLRAASDFTQARLYVDLSTSQFYMQEYQKTGTPGWVAQGGTTGLSQGVSYGFGAITAPPSSTQPAIGQAPACLDNAGNAIANTACFVFNSRGIPIVCNAVVAGTGCTPADPENRDAVYVTDGTA